MIRETYILDRRVKPTTIIKDLGNLQIGGQLTLVHLSNFLLHILLQLLEAPNSQSTTVCNHIACTSTWSFPTSNFTHIAHIHWIALS